MRLKCENIIKYNLPAGLKMTQTNRKYFMCGHFTSDSSPAPTCEVFHQCVKKTKPHQCFKHVLVFCIVSALSVMFIIEHQGGEAAP